MSTNIWVWIAALLSLAIFSYLYKDNPAFKFAEHLFTGLSVGYFIVLYWNNYTLPYIVTPLKNHQWITLIPMAIGMMYLFRFIPKLNHLILIPIAVSLGFWNGMSIPVTFEADVLKQIQGTMINTSMLSNIWDPQKGLMVGLLVMVGVISTITYFYFSREHKGPQGHRQHRHLVRDDRLRGHLRIHRHGPGLAADRPDAVPVHRLDTSDKISRPRGSLNVRKAIKVISVYNQQP